MGGVIFFKMLLKCAVCIKTVMTHPVISAGRLCVQQRLSWCLDGHRFVTTTAAVSTFRTMAVPPIPGRQMQEVFRGSEVGFRTILTSVVGHMPVVVLCQ